MCFPEGLSFVYVNLTYVDSGYVGIFLFRSIYEDSTSNYDQTESPGSSWVLLDVETKVDPLYLRKRDYLKDVSTHSKSWSDKRNIISSVDFYKREVKFTSFLNLHGCVG